MRWDISRAPAMSWVTTTEVTFVRSAIEEMRLLTVAAFTGSSPVTGSS